MGTHMQKQSGVSGVSLWQSEVSGVPCAWGQPRTACPPLPSCILLLNPGPGGTFPPRNSRDAPGSGALPSLTSPVHPKARGTSIPHNLAALTPHCPGEGEEAAVPNQPQPLCADETCHGTPPVHPPHNGNGP